MVSWSASDPSGIASYDVQFADGPKGRWVSWRTGTTARSRAFTGAEGHTYYFRARARDAAGNLGAFSSPRRTSVPVDDAHLSYSSGWKKTSQSGAYLGSTHYAKLKGKTASRTFAGSAVVVRVTKGKGRGKAGIYLDGKLVKTIDTYATKTRVRQAVYSASVPLKSHKITVKVLGTKGRPRVDVDGIEFFSPRQTSAEPALILVSPGPMVVNRYETQQFTAVAYSPTGAALPVNPTWSVVGSPTVGTVGQDGLFTATRGGAGTVRVSVPGMSTDVRVSVVTDVSGTLSESTTWTPEGSPYVITDDLTVPSGITLTAEPGTVVKVSGWCKLDVQGTLIAGAAASPPVYFTSLKDDSAGGDTNLDRSSTTPAAGDWGTIFVEGSATMDNCVVRYGGGYIPWMSAPGCAVDGVSGSALSVRGCEFANDAVGLMADHVASLVLTGTSMHDNTTSDAVINDPPALDLVGNTSTAGIVLRGTAQGDVTLRPNHGAYVVGTDDGIANYLSIPATATLAVQPGAVVKIAHWSYLDVEGTLTAPGTSTSPIYFTSYKDDTLGGDTNLDHGSTTPTAGDWGTVRVEGSATMDNCVVRYGGGYIPWGVPQGSALMGMPSSSLCVSGSAFAWNSGAAVQGWSPDAVRATECYWGDPSGPWPSGRGDGVSFTTDFRPLQGTTTTWWQPILSLEVDDRAWVGVEYSTPTVSPSVAWEAYAHGTTGGAPFLDYRSGLNPHVGRVLPEGYETARMPDDAFLQTINEQYTAMGHAYVMGLAGASLGFDYAAVPALSALDLPLNLYSTYKPVSELNKTPAEINAEYQQFRSDWDSGPGVVSVVFNPM